MPHATHSQISFAEPDATADFYSALQDPSRWIIKPGVPIFKPHVRTDPNTGKEIRVDVQKLHEIANNIRKLEEDGGVPVRITLGHTQPGQPETRQPPVAGYYRNPRVGVFGPKREPAIIADEWLDPQYGQVRKNFPYRSSEYYDDDKSITGVALLARDPYLDLGVVAYSKASPGPIHYHRAGSCAPYLFVFGEDKLPAPIQPPVPPAAGQSYYANVTPPTGYSEYAAPTAYAAANDGVAPSTYTDPAVRYAQPQPPPATMYAGTWPGPAYRRASIGKQHSSAWAYRDPRGPVRSANTTRPRRYADDEYPLPGGQGGMPPMGPGGQGGMPPMGPGGQGGMPPMGPGGQGGMAEAVQLLEQAVNILADAAGLGQNDEPADSPFPRGEEDSFDGGMPQGPDDVGDEEFVGRDHGEPDGDEDSDEEDDTKYSYRGRQTSYAPPRMSMAGGPDIDGRMTVSTANPRTYIPGRFGRSSTSGAGQFGVARPGQSAMGSPPPRIVGSPRPSESYQSSYGLFGGPTVPSSAAAASRRPFVGTSSGTSFNSASSRPAAYRAPGRPIPQSRPSARYYSRTEPMAQNPQQPAPQGVRPQQTGRRQAPPAQYAALPQTTPLSADARIRGDRLAYEVDRLKKQNDLLMYERDQADTEWCVSEIRRLASAGYPVDEFEVNELKARPKHLRSAYLETIATRYSRVPSDGIAPPPPGDPSPEHLNGPTGPVRLTREGMEEAVKLAESTGMPLDTAMRYMRGEAAPVQYGPQPAVGQGQPLYAAPGYGQPALPPQFAGGQFADPYQGY